MIIYYVEYKPIGAMAREKFNVIKSPFWTFFINQSFSSCGLFRFWSLGYPRVRWLGWQAQTCVQNLP